MNVKPVFQKSELQLDIEATSFQISSKIRQDVLTVLRRSGVVIGLSGGIDSSVTLGLVVRALGPKRVLGLIMPERDSNPDSVALAQQLAQEFGVETIVEDLTQVLEGFGCYRRRDEAIKRVFSEYDPSIHKVKIVLPQNILDEDTFNLFSATIVAPDGTEKSKRLPLKALLQIVAASNFKQRSRMSMLYYHAESRNYAVVGTPNKQEHQQGFFVKYGDGGADLMPIIQLYKTQVYQLAHHLGIPEVIRKRPPTSDTYSAECTQEEFFFQMPWKLMDLLWYAYEKNYAPAEVAPLLELSEKQVVRAFRNFAGKQRTTAYLRMAPISHYQPVATRSNP